ncbi:Aquaporin-3 [Entomophthora muscae]|uniref:Aquaporin-3 n=2 Tax=Entomophthora muscae TaxID=34485 RepID=A0ACC2SAA1_9FUNG|nr:Aquaporin-3 [Entomophthora muscae]KAJ9059216.1 Aquaporin-3 [Entomophthora muscae]
MASYDETIMDEANLSYTVKPTASLRDQSSFREYFAEYIGTLVLVLCGTGASAQVLINRSARGTGFLTVNIGWSLGIVCGILLAGPVSGAHLNPAITFANALFGKFSWHKTCFYIFSQLLGAFSGAALTYVVYWPAFADIDDGTRRISGKKGTADIFATYPHASDPAFNCFFTEVIATVFLVMGLLAITNPKHRIPIWGVAVLGGVLVAAIGISIGFMTGYAMNPARDLGPRFFTAIAGWGWGTFTANNYYFWIPLTAPFVGAILATVIYESLVDPPDFSL